MQSTPASRPSAPRGAGPLRLAWRGLAGSLRLGALILPLVLALGLAAGSVIAAFSATVFGLAASAVELVAEGRGVRAGAERARRADLDAVERRARAQAEEVAGLERRVSAQADHLTSLEGRLAAQADEAAALRRLAADAPGPALRRQVSDAVDGIATRSVRVQAANIGSMAGEALPFVGVAVIAAATAFEVKSTCDTVRDLQALDRAFNPDREVDVREVCGLHVPTAGEVWAAVRDSPGAAWVAARGFFSELPDWDWSLTYGWLLDSYDWVALSLWRDAPP